MVEKLKFYKLVCEYRFRPTLLYYEHKNRIANALLPSYKHWGTDGTKINLSDFQLRNVLGIEHNRLVLEWDLPPSMDDFKRRFRNALKEYTRALPIENYLRLGMKTIAMLPVEFRLDELVDATHKKLLSQDQGLSKIVGTEVRDYMYSIIAKRSGLDIHIVCGPVKKEQIPRLYQPCDVVVSKGETPKTIDYADVSFFIDCDCYTNKPTYDLAKSFPEEAAEIAQTIPKEIVAYLFGE